MGWAKYYEDNVSICIGRMAIKDSIHAIHNQVNNFKTSEIKREAKVYPVAEDKAGVLKTPSNRRYAEERARRYHAQIILGAEA